MTAKIKHFWVENGLNRIPMMMGFFGNALPLYAVGLLAAASAQLLADVFAGQLYAVVTSANGDMSQFAAELLRVFMLLAVVVAVTGIGSILYLRTTAQADCSLRKALVDSCLHMPVHQWMKRHTADWLSAIGRDADDASEIYKEYGMRLVQCVISVCGGLVIILGTSWSMAIFAVVVGFCYMWFGISRSKVRRKLETLMRSASVSHTQVMGDMISGSRTARFYPIRSFIEKRYEETRGEVYGHSRRIARARSVDAGFGALGYTLSYSGALVFGLLMVNAGKIGLPQMLAMWPISMGVTFGITDLGFLLTDFQSVAAAANRVHEVLMVPREQGGTIEDAVNEGPAVSLEHVDFSYGDTPVIQDISLTIKPGEKVAIVGGSGSGKSTLMKLLLRFYEPDAGKISIFGTDAGEYSLQGLRNQFSFVPQSAGVYSGTIYDNLLLSSPDSDRRAMEEALGQAGAGEWIASLPHGMDTEVGEGGGKLSGGQKQRIAVARAFLRDAPIMIFDEATAALDGETETIITDSLTHARADQTLILITHRLSTALLAERIVVLENGRIAEMGDHKDLLDKGGIYAKLWEVK